MRPQTPLPEPLAGLRPMLLAPWKGASLDDPDTAYEIKFDGYRCLAQTTSRGARLMTRNGADATAWFPEVVNGLRQLYLPPSTVLDGEICVLDEIGRSDFDAVHRRALARRYVVGLPQVVYCAFDILFDGAADLRPHELRNRQQRLAERLAIKAPSILLVTGFVGQGRWLYDQAVALKLEGIVCKRLSSPYQAGDRSTDWQKKRVPGAVPPQRFSRTGTRKAST